MVNQELQEQGEQTNRPTEKQYWIVVNGRRKTAIGHELTFEQIVGLAFEPVPTGENIIFDITFRRAAPPQSEGSLLPGEVVKIKDGTIFNVTFTDKS